MEGYDFRAIEAKWQRYWEENKIFKCDKDPSREKFLCAGDVSLSLWCSSHGAPEELRYR